MDAVFYIAGAVAVLATLFTITRANAVHALLYLIVSLLGVAVVFFTLGAPFVAALEVIVYAGAIMVLFVFVVMILNLGEQAELRERQWLKPGVWVGPGILAAVLLGEVVYLLSQTGAAAGAGNIITPKQVGIALFGPYVLGVELASILLLGGVVGAYHLGRRQPLIEETQHGVRSDDSRTAPGGDLVHAGNDRSARTA
jgi:NADH-quinone oxidoreductase subunit J